MRDKICIGLLILGIMCLTIGFTGIIREKHNLEDELSTAQFEAISLQEELSRATEDVQQNIKKNQELTSELEKANQVIEDLKDSEYELVYLGDFKITYYCDGRYPHICGGNGVTASGKLTNVGVTAAADWSVLPKGSTVYIDGVGFREIQDVGGSVDGKHIDVLVKEHQEALNLGTKYKGVWILVKNS